MSLLTLNRTISTVGPRRVSRRLALCLGAAVWTCLSAAALLIVPPEAGGAALGSFLNTRNFPQERQVLQGAANRQAFPNLGNNFEVLQPSSSRYNCIAHSLGIHTRWIDPQTGPANSVLGPMDRMYAAQGYARSGRLDFRLESGKQKVVLYARISGGQVREVTHAALQSRDGTWTSKLGKLALIRHPSPTVLNGPEYGAPVAVYVRSVR
jgi:hypothetical protein